MKIILNILLLIGACIALTSCQSSDVDSASSAISISGEFLELKFDGAATTEGSERKVVVTTTSDWSVAPNQEDGSADWITCSTTGGKAGINTFYLSVDVNTMSDIRHGSVVVSSGSEQITLKIEQALYYRLEVAKDYFSYDGRKHLFEVLVSTNAPAEDVQVVIPVIDRLGTVTPTTTTDEWGFEIEGEPIYGWIGSKYIGSITASNGYNEVRFEIEIDAQTEGEVARESQLTVTYPFGGVLDCVTISQNQLPTLSIPEDQSVEYYTLTTPLTIDSNVEIDTVLESEWLSISEGYTEVGNERTYILTLSKNDTGADRSSVITFENVESQLSDEIVITQKKKDVVIAIDETKLANYELTQTYISNNNFVVEVMANVALDATIESDNSWLTIVDATPNGKDSDEDEANGDDKIYTFVFDLTTNTDGVLRDAEVVFSSRETHDVGTPITFTLTQDKQSSFVEIKELETLQAMQPYTANDSFVVKVYSTDDALTATTPDWISGVESVAVSAADYDNAYTHTYTLSLAENFAMGAMERNEAISFTSVDDASVEASVVISQEVRIPVVTIVDKAVLESTTNLFNVGSLSFTVDSDVTLTPSVFEDGWSVMQRSEAGKDGVMSSYIFDVTIPESSSITDIVVPISLVNNNHKVDQTLNIKIEALPSTAIIDHVVSGQFATEIADMQAAGTLNADLSTYRRLVVSGVNIGGNDYVTISEKFTNLEYIDISGTSSTAVTGSSFINNNKLKQIILPQTIKSFGGSAFKNCTSLITITISKLVDIVGPNLFMGCTGLKSVIIEEGVTQMGSAMFSGCTSLESVTVPSTITTWNSEGVAGNTFLNCTSLKSVTFTEGLTCIGSNAFQGCSALEAINLPSTLTKWEVNKSGQSLAFSKCTKATTLSIPEGVEEIGALAFSECTSIEEVTIPSTVVRYPKSSVDVNQAFQSCTGITNVTFGDGLTTVVSNLFQGCTAIKAIYSYSAIPPVITPATVANIADTYYAVQSGKTATVTYIPAGAIAAYQAAEGWSKQTNYKEIE